MVRVSREDFAEVLYYWVTKDLREEKIRETASFLHLEIKSDETYDTILRELLILNTYLAVTVAGRVFEDEEKGNGCLDLLHRLVFDRHYGETGVTFGDWKTWMSTRYLEYQQASESDPKHPPGPLWGISKTVNKRLFGEIKLDPFIQASISQYIALNLKHLTGLIREYDIE